jgi:catechol 2,3-dioxygenase-like lactoylglutathione lyase family enzyme
MWRNESDTCSRAFDVRADRGRLGYNLVAEARVELHVPRLVDLLAREERGLLLGVVRRHQAGELRRDPLLGNHQRRECEEDDLLHGRVDPRPLLLVLRQVDVERAPLGVLPAAVERLWIVELDLAHHPTLCSGGDMTLQRMDNVLIVVDDLEAAKAFFAELGMELEGETTVEGPSVDQTVGLNDVRADIAMMRTPDGHGRVELSKFHTPPAVRAEPASAPANTLGIRRIMFAVDDIDDVVARLRGHGAELVGEIAQYEDIYRLCFVRGPEGVIIGLAEQLS